LLQNKLSYIHFNLIFLLTICGNLLVLTLDLVFLSAGSATETKSETKTGHLDWQHFPTALERVLTRCNLRVNLESCLGKCLAAAPERLLASAGSLTFTRANFGESFGQVKYLASMRRWERNACVAGNCRWANAAAPAGTMALGRADSGESRHLPHTRD